MVSIREDPFGGEDAAATKKIRPEDLRTGTLFGSYDLRGRLYVLKDNANAVSGYLSFGTSRATAPTSKSTGTGQYQDYTGLFGLQSDVVHSAVGNLNGLYGYVADTYGAAFGKYASNKPNVTIDETNGIRFRNGATMLGQWDTSGVITLGTVGSDIPNIQISGTQILFRNNTTTQASITAATGVAAFSSITTNILYLALSEQDFTGTGDKEINVGPYMDASYVRMTTDNNCNLIGVSEGFADGQIVVILHVSGNTVTLIENSGAVTAGVGPIRTGTGADRAMVGRWAIWLLWNADLANWELTSFSA
jgi:hypothetical protein